MAARWLLLIHQIPPTPPYFRAKVGRRLHRIGAVAIKNAVYALPYGEQTREDFQWVAREIIGEGGEATLCEANLIEGLRDEQVQALFNAAREAEFEALADEARSSTEASDLARLQKRIGEILAIDFFEAPGRVVAESAIAALEKKVRGQAKPTKKESKPSAREFHRRTWVTRKNIHVDRIASAWLVRRFIDPKPTFRFVVGQGYVPKKGEVTFDMFEATFTHVGDRCTFEVLLDRFELEQPGLAAIGEIVHDIDIKDGKFARPEVAGVASMIAGIALGHRDDEERLEIGGTLFDALLAVHERKRT